MTKPLTITQAAERLGVERKHVQALIDAGDLPAFNVARSDGRYKLLRIESEALETFIETRATGEAKTPRRLSPRTRARRERAGLPT